MKNSNSKEISRRDFIKGAAVGTGALAVVGMNPASATADTAMPKKWNKEADVVVVGYGGAGAVTAITARNKGSKVLILEKQSEKGHTSNTQMCLVFLSVLRVFPRPSLTCRWLHV